MIQDQLRSFFGGLNTQVPPAGSVRGAPANNSHVHIPPNFSAFRSLDEVAERAGAEGCRLLGFSNYYDFHAYDPMTRLCLARDVLPLFGLEIIALEPELERRKVLVNDPKNPGKIYVCGKGISRFENPTPRAAGLLGKIRARDGARLAGMLEKVNDHLTGQGIDVRLQEGALKQWIATPPGLPVEWVYLQERHVAQGLWHEISSRARPAEILGKLLPGYQEAWGPAKTQGKLRDTLLKAGCPAFVPEEYGSMEEALTLIDELGGRRVYPIIGDGIPGLSEFERDTEGLMRALRGWNIGTVEFIPTRNSAAWLEATVRPLVQGGFTVTAGTEHNTPEMEPMLPACRGGVPLSAEARAAFAAGALAILRDQLRGFFGPEEGNSLADRAETSLFAGV